ncbi:MAG: type II toxin-antitoxin system RelE/ParE family toxin [Coriobacteriales bacterium]|jgi:plasmid stabilization system protein ParE|nr:type II toxin-antitoxin system RelE/ParE family toxin [Coriobacteriales bacterium]
MHRLVFSPAAHAKLDDVFDYIANTLSTPQAATSTIAGIIDSLGILKNNPDAGPRLSSRINHVPDRFAETRFLVCGNFVAIYDHDNSEVRILRIYHAREDAFGRFFSEID